MPQILHTRNLGAAIHALAESYPRVLVRAKAHLRSPIRLRRADVADMNPYVCMNPRGFDGQRDAWNEKGGVLIYYRSYQRDERLERHEAQMICECPTQMRILRNMTEGAHEAIVIYKPPNWREHERYVLGSAPSLEACRRYYELVTSAATRADIGEALGLQPGFHAVSDAWIVAALGLNNNAEAIRFRNVVFRKSEYKIVMQLIPRHPPDDHTLVSLYQWLLTLPTIGGGVRLVEGMRAVSRKMRYWNQAFADLERCGSIARKDTVVCYYAPALGPNWGRLRAAHTAAKEDLQEIARMVDSSPELRLPDALVTRPRSSDVPA